MFPCLAACLSRLYSFAVIFTYFQAWAMAVEEMIELMKGIKPIPTFDHVSKLAQNKWSHSDVYYLKSNHECHRKAASAKMLY